MLPVMPGLVDRWVMSKNWIIASLDIKHSVHYRQKRLEIILLSERYKRSSCSVARSMRNVIPGWLDILSWENSYRRWKQQAERASCVSVPFLPVPFFSGLLNSIPRLLCWPCMASEPVRRDWERRVWASCYTCTAKRLPSFFNTPM